MEGATCLSLCPGVNSRRGYKRPPVWQKNSLKEPWSGLNPKGSCTAIPRGPQPLSCSVQIQLISRPMRSHGLWLLLPIILCEGRAKGVTDSLGTLPPAPASWSSTKPPSVRSRAQKSAPLMNSAANSA